MTQPSDEMVERVARAMWEASGNADDHQFGAWEDNEQPIEGQPSIADVYRKHARAAITATGLVEENARLDAALTTAGAQYDKLTGEYLKANLELVRLEGLVEENTRTEPAAAPCDESMGVWTDANRTYEKLIGRLENRLEFWNSGGRFVAAQAIRDLTAENTRLKALGDGLAKFTEHDSACEVFVHPMRCTCGLSAALAAWENFDGK